MDKVLQYIKNLFMEPNGGGMKWGSVLSTALGAAGGWYFGGPIGGVAGLVGGTLLGGVLDGFFTSMGLNPIRPMPTYPDGVRPLQPTVDLPAPVRQQDQSMTANIVRSPLLESLRVPTMSLPNTQRIRTDIAGILRTGVGTERIPGLQRDLQEGERTIMQFNMTFDEYLRSRADYYRQGGERERLVDSVARATNGLGTPMDRATAEAFVPTLPGLGTDIRPEDLGDALCGFNSTRVNPANTALYRAECEKRRLGQPHRIFSSSQLRGWHTHPQDGGIYFIEISSDTVMTMRPSTYNVEEYHRPLLTLTPEVETYGRSIFLSTATNTADQWTAKTTHEKLNIILTHVEAQRGRYERGDQQVSWSSLPAPSTGNGPWSSAWRFVTTGDTPNFNNSTEEECVATIRSIMVPSNGSVTYPGMHSALRQSTTRARMLAQGRNAGGAVAEYDKILRYCDLLQQHCNALGALQRVGIVNDWRARFRDAKLVPAEADAHDFVQYRLPMFNETKIAIMSHGQKTPDGIGRGHFITYRDCNQPNAETVTAFCTRQADGTYKITHAWKGEYTRNIRWNDARLATPLDMDRATIDALETRDGRINNQSLAQTLRGINVTQLAGLQSLRAPGDPAQDRAELAMLESGPGNTPTHQHPVLDTNILPVPANDDRRVLASNTVVPFPGMQLQVNPASHANPLTPTSGLPIIAASPNLPSANT